MRLTGADEADKLVQAAIALHGAGRLADAAQSLHHALQIDPKHKIALTRLAAIATEKKDDATALALLGAVLRDEPNFAPALHVLSQALWQSGSPDEGLAAARRAVFIQPANADYRLALAQFCTWYGHHEAAADILATVAREDWHEPEVRALTQLRLAELCIAAGRFAEAEPILQRSLALAPHHAATHVVRGMNLLRLGRFTEGWPGYALRRALPQSIRQETVRLPGLPWRGEDLRGKTILLRDDQGFGDAIQFFRFAAAVKQRGPARIVLQTFAPLRALFAAAAPFAEVQTALPATFTADYHAFMADLPGILGVTVDTIPVPVPYLAPVRDRLAAGRQLPDTATLRVGVVWNGAPQHLTDHLRSIPAERFLRLTRIRGASFYTLQPQLRPADEAALQANAGPMHLGPSLASFADTASVLARLDLVITVDTAVAHLAGAMNRPVWILLSRAPDWRWLTDRVDSPWYPSARLFRAGEAGWDPVLDDVARALRALVRAWRSGRPHQGQDARTGVA